jgi:hypothetical protein
MIPTGLPNQFLNWRTEDGRKVPCLRDGRKCSAHDPANWITYEEAQAAPYGVAFALSANDPWFFLDLDKCFVDGQWTAEADAIFNAFPGAWGEVSQSGTGLHVMGYCDKSKLADRRNKWAGWLEFYIQERFIAFSENGWQRIGGVDIDYDWTEVLLKIVPEREFLGELPEGIDPTYTGPEDDGELLNLAMRSKSTASAFGDAVSFKDLWEKNEPVLAAKWPDYGGKGTFDHSSADMALMCQLAFWTGKDMPRMDRLFRQSALMRGKYEDRDDYRKNTIQLAARKINKVYDVPKKSTKAKTDYSHHEAFLSITEMQDKFKDCIYVRDQHGVLMPDGDIIKPEQFSAYYGGHLFAMMEDGTRPSNNAFDAFTRNTIHQFPRAKTTMFRPDLEFQAIRDERVNIYVAPEIESYPGDVSRLMYLLEKQLPDENDRAILINYCASAVQNVGTKFRWAPVLQGVEGNGKTTLGLIVAYCMSRRYHHSPKAAELGEKYNGFLEGNVWITIDEVHQRDRMEMLDIMKPMITDDWVEVRKMRTDKYMTENKANFYMCTNHKDAIIKTDRDRRYAIFFCGQQEASDLVRDGLTEDFWIDFYDWLHNHGGMQACAHWLQTFPIDPQLDPAGKAVRAPITSSTNEAIAISRSPLEQQLMDAIESRMQYFRGGWLSMEDTQEMFRNVTGRTPTVNVLRKVIAQCGYVEWGRSPKPLLPQMNDKLLFVHKDVTETTFDNYCQHNELGAKR